MSHWRKRAYEVLLTAGAIALNQPEWVDYAAYCELRHKGLRREALKRLDDFIKLMAGSDFEQRRRFVAWWFPLADDEDGYLLRPEPLVQHVIKPTLAEWTEREPDNPEPHIMIGFWDHLNRALELSPGHPDAATRLAKLVLKNLDYALHEMPWGLLGDESELMKALDVVDGLLIYVDDHGLRVALQETSASYRRVLQSYLDWLISSERRSGEEFSTWAAARDRQHSIGYQTIYYKK